MAEQGVELPSDRLSRRRGREKVGMFVVLAPIYQCLGCLVSVASIRHMHLPRKFSSARLRQHDDHPPADPIQCKPSVPSISVRRMTFESISRAPPRRSALAMESAVSRSEDARVMYVAERVALRCDLPLVVLRAGTTNGLEVVDPQSNDGGRGLAICKEVDSADSMPAPPPRCPPMCLAMGISPFRDPRNCASVLLGWQPKLAVAERRSMDHTLVFFLALPVRVGPGCCLLVIGRPPPRPDEVVAPGIMHPCSSCPDCFPALTLCYAARKVQSWAP